MEPLADIIKSLDQWAVADLWQQVTASYVTDETECLQALMTYARPAETVTGDITTRAVDIVEEVRKRHRGIHMIDAMLHEYSLDTQEGIMLMCLAEALLRIPDKETADALIEDRLSAANWNQHLGKSNSLLVNASTWGLLLSGKMIGLEQSFLSSEDTQPGGILNRLLKKTSEPLIRGALGRAMKIMGNQFVLGATLPEALSNAEKYRQKGYRYSFDMLGEAALTITDAEMFFYAYRAAIEDIAHTPSQQRDPGANTVSVKLSALHPRYEASQSERVLTELTEVMHKLLDVARNHNVAITLDAEEADRLELSLQVFASLYQSRANRGWGKLGLAVQAYSLRAFPVLLWLTALARKQGDEIPLRLVKGAYWDTEIKLAQQRGLAGYPVFTRKEATDVSYLACVRYLLSDTTRDIFYPQFATHNAHTVAAVLVQAQTTGRAFEFQRLHGMGDTLYQVVLETTKAPVRIYAPVGAHKELLPYLVRRLLENGANTSFVNRLVDARASIGQLVQHPVNQLSQCETLRNERIPLPADIYPGRLNSSGYSLAAQADCLALQNAMSDWENSYWEAGPIISGKTILQQSDHELLSPHNRNEAVGSVVWAKLQHIDQALDEAENALLAWQAEDVDSRAIYLERFAELLQENEAELMQICCREAGKTIADGLDEVREAVDFCRYYAQQARELMTEAIALPGVTGEANQLYFEGKGIFLCISPWNFPLAIYVGQIAAALVTGNVVIAKPAEQTPLIAFRAAQLLLETELPEGVFQFLPGEGRVAKTLMGDRRVAGVAFTGSIETAQLINRCLAGKPGPIGTLIAETGGQNAMIADSTALPEQVVKDVLLSAFQSACQRCSALRVLFLQKEIADRVKRLLAGAMAELQFGNPGLLSTDIGPVIDQKVQQGLLSHISVMSEVARWQVHTELPERCLNGTFVPACAFEIDRLNQLDKEHFGPVLHIICYEADDLDEVIEQINQTGFGLTLGIHSRNESVAAWIESQVRVGNTYINRHQVGAAVGAQPFGGQGLSGTGPKAGGPHYLYRFLNERTSTSNTAAVGGNATLLSGGERLSGGETLSGSET